jgi:trehalose 6-phosphate phosphatase
LTGPADLGVAGADANDPLAVLRADPDRTALLLDFDGSLSEIVEHPDLARPVEGARDVLAGLTAEYRLVAVVSGRPTDDVARVLDVPSVRYAGHYGRLVDQAPLSERTREGVQAASTGMAGVWPEDKAESLAVHYRLAADPAAARQALVGPLDQIARDEGLELLEGKMVLELVRPDAPRKGDAVTRLVREAGAAAVMFAGDDLADLEAFDALDRLADEGVAVVKVAVRGRETPEVLLRAADVTVDGPPGLVELLRALLQEGQRSNG